MTGASLHGNYCYKGVKIVNGVEKAKVTRQRNAEARKARQTERYAQEKADRALVLEALRGVLHDPEASAEQRLYAVAVLDGMEGYNFIPYSVKHPGKGSSELVAEFAKMLEEREGER